MKRVLIITYYWPPSGGAGVQRWLKMSKYLPSEGWLPIVYTPENPEIHAVDKSLLHEVHPDIIEIKQKIFEPYNAYRMITGGKKNNSNQSTLLSQEHGNSYFKKIGVWLRSNIFIPDPRFLWIRPSIRFLKKYLKENPVDVIVTTGPPHSMHLIGHGLKDALGTPWVADFRDPWTFIDFFHKLSLTEFALNRHQFLEKKVVKNASSCVTVSPSWAREYEKRYNRKFDVIFNGYDEADFQNLNKPLSDLFTIVHSGSINEDRNPSSLWKVLNELCRENERFASLLRIKLVGKLATIVTDELRQYELLKATELVDYLPHQDIACTNSSAQVLLLLINDTPNSNGIIPGKVFEYLAAGRPILSIGNDTGDAAHIIYSTNSGENLTNNETKKLKKIIIEWFDAFNSGSLELKSDTAEIKKYTRKNSARKFSLLFNEVLQKMVLSEVYVV